MNSLALAVFEDTYPALCVNMGLTCDVCTAESARNLARTCKGLRPPAVRQLFVQIYPDPACSSMAPHFERHYREASAVPKPHSIAMPKTVHAAFQDTKALATVA